MGLTCKCRYRRFPFQSILWANRGTQALRRRCPAVTHPYPLKGQTRPTQTLKTQSHNNIQTHTHTQTHTYTHTHTHAHTNLPSKRALANATRTKAVVGTFEPIGVARARVGVDVT